MQADEELRQENEELKAELERLRQACDDMQTLVAGSDIGVLSLDDQLCIKRFTPKAAMLFGLEPGDEGKSIGSLRQKLDDDRFADDALEVLRTKKTCQRRAHFRNEDWSVRMRAHSSAENGAECVVVTLLQREGCTVDKATIEMTSAFVHEINQPLTAAVTYLNVVRRLLTSGSCKPDDIVEIIDKASKELLRTGAILARLRDRDGQEESDETA